MYERTRNEGFGGTFTTMAVAMTRSALPVRMKGIRFWLVTGVAVVLVAITASALGGRFAKPAPTGGK